MRRLIAVLLSLLAVTATAAAQDSDLPPRQLRVRAIGGMIESSGDASLQQFIDANLAPSLRASVPADRLLDRLRAIRAACAGAAGVTMRPQGADSTEVEYITPGGRHTKLTFAMDPQPPHLVTAIELGATEEPPPSAAIPPFTWDQLGPQLEAQVANGFSGTVLVVRADSVVMQRGFGLANRERKIPNGPNTIFGIGSVPIDFTRAAILKLEELGKLKTSDPITRYLDNVPADKAAITIDMLMAGSSGLPNFHDNGATDRDPNLSWVDRDTAMRRILAAKLLFPPGTDHAHSHSAWVMLAAIVERVSHEGYGAFLKQYFFGPAGMTRTGLHEDAARFAYDQFAIAYDGEVASKLNCPKYWGKTSWLVMGSGGMYSTPGDLYRWIVAIRSGKTLSAPYAARFWQYGLLTGGDLHGYLCQYREGPGDYFIVCANGHSGLGGHSNAVVAALDRLVTGGPPKYSLGIQLNVTPDGAIVVAGVAPGSAAEGAGLKSGDRLVSAAGHALSDPPMRVLAPLLQDGTPITFEVERDGAKRTVAITPQARH